MSSHVKPVAGYPDAHQNAATIELEVVSSMVEERLYELFSLPTAAPLSDI
jgi:hypothetical protein